MTNIATSVAKHLDQLDIQLDNDAIEYISSMLEDMSIQDMSTVRESIDDFLTDANVPTDTMETFYALLLEDINVKQDSNSNAPKPLTTETTLKAVTKDKPGNTGIPAETVTKTDKDDKASSHASVASEISGESKKSRLQTRRERRKDQRNNAEENSDDEPNIVAISQQSRFQREIDLEASSYGIDLPGVNLTVNETELLVDAHLKLKPGTRYGLVGQNGVGKTTMMKVMSDGTLVGLPQTLRILHVAQIEIADEQQTVIEELMSADKDATVTLEEYSLLNKEMESSGKMSLAVYEVMLKRQRLAVQEQLKLATKRSGERGREARRLLVEAEKALKDLESKDPTTFVTETMVTDTTAQVFEKFGLLDRDSFKAKAQSILHGLGFTAQDIASPVQKFSGGWRMRIALAKSLLVEPDVLLLDEPTNHLDLPAILWLQEYLVSNYNSNGTTTVVVVSHDRSFLNQVTEETIILRDKQLKYHAGNYDDWERNTDEQRIRKQALLDIQEKKRQNIVNSIEYNVRQAKATGDDKRLGQVASRKKKLERLGMEKSEDGKRWKVSYYAGYHESSRVEIAVEQTVKTAAIKIPDPTPLRYHGPIFRMDDVSFSYPGSSTLINKLSLNITPASRIAFLGSNGSGKTTVINLLVGNLVPSSGTIYRHPLLRIGYFSQHDVDQLDPEKTPVQILLDRYPTLKEQGCRQHFGSVGISGPVVLRKVKHLSGGQRSRIALASILIDEPHVLVLDEITNHLDMGTIAVLADALSEFSGALILVSHDMWFLKRIMENKTNDSGTQEPGEEPDDRQILLVRPGKITQWEKGLDAYVDTVLSRVQKAI